MLLCNSRADSFANYQITIANQRQFLFSLISLGSNRPSCPPCWPNRSEPMGNNFAANAMRLQFDYYFYCSSRLLEPGDLVPFPFRKIQYCFFRLFAVCLLLNRSWLLLILSYCFFFYRQVVNSTQRQRKLAEKMRKMVLPAPRNYASKWKTHFVLSFAAHLPRTWKLLSSGIPEKSQLPQDPLRCSKKKLNTWQKLPAIFWRGKVRP